MYFVKFAPISEEFKIYILVLYMYVFKYIFNIIILYVYVLYAKRKVIY